MDSHCLNDEPLAAPRVFKKISIKRLLLHFSLFTFIFYLFFYFILKAHQQRIRSLQYKFCIRYFFGL